MEKRLEFECWNCQKTYSLLREIEGNPTLWVACPFCGKDGLVELDPFRKKVDTVYRGDEPPKGTGDKMVYDLPDILPTKQPPPPD
ncbi:MAG TPA: hypothetical protein P5526_21115 [Anaerolineae bacterium]|nr:hypothetical protein [Anaerolineae bacterium]